VALDARSVVDRAHAALRERILSGELGPGERLHQEALSAELGVSRTPVREALGRLAADGLVELLPQRGARVADLRPEDMAAAYEARLAIEPVAARLAAARGGGEGATAAMRAAVAAHRRAGGDVASAFQANRAFHLAVVEAAGNPFLLRFAEGLWATRLGLRVYEEQRESPDLIAADADAHERIADAVAAGDPEAAEALMREHIGCAMRLLLDHLGAG
jgi:DNA-binding GntR family transcriptional regulator